MTTRFPAAAKGRFGPDWPGRRCEAKTRRGTPCQKPSLIGNARCQIHGGRGGAPSGPLNGNYKHGRCTKAAMKQHRQDMTELRELERLGRALGMFV